MKITIEQLREMRREASRQLEQDSGHLKVQTGLKAGFEQTEA